jgi:hypothetical protein
MIKTLFLRFSHKNLLELEVRCLNPKDAARKAINHIDSLRYQDFKIDKLI